MFGAIVGYRTFHGRKGRMSEHKRDTLERLGARYLRTRPVDLAAWFTKAGPLVVEIGFGMGEATAVLAASRPDERVIACEVHTAGVANLCALLELGDLRNIVVMGEDGLDVLATLPTASVDEVRAFFPDPWPKQGQRHRRIIQPNILSLIVTKLATGARLCLATDDDGYAGQMEKVCGDHPALDGGRIARPAWRPVTKFERRGVAKGHTITDLQYTVRSAS
jgi:tRNA (guanine-N7-)-methyltransferase